MQIEHFHNACCIVKSTESTRILCDPWFNPGAFCGSWALAHPIHRPIPVAFQDFDLLYISHIHPDHFDQIFLRSIDKSIPIIIPNEQPISILKKKLEALGFKKIIPLDNCQTFQYSDLELTLFTPFLKSRMHADYELPNFLDSALLISDGQSSFLNTNDNYPSIDSIKWIEENYGVPDILSLLYNSAGFYPQSVNNFSVAEKIAEKHKVVERCFQMLLETSMASSSKYIMPFAGDYALTGKLWNLNQFLPVSTPKVASNFLEKKGINTLCLGSGGIFCLKSDRYLKQGTHYTIEDAMIHAESPKWLYPYEIEKQISTNDLRKKLPLASKKMEEKQHLLNCFPDWEIELISEDQESIYNIDCSRSTAKNYMQCVLDKRLLNGILDRKYHWDNAQIGCHINFTRSSHPSYSSELHTLLAFIHL